MSHLVYLVEHNAWIFEDWERTAIELRVLMFNSLYVSMAAHISFSSYSFLEFIDLCSFSPSL